MPPVFLQLYVNNPSFFINEPGKYPRHNAQLTLIDF